MMEQTQAHVAGSAEQQRSVKAETRVLCRRGNMGTLEWNKLLPLLPCFMGHY